MKKSKIKDLPLCCPKCGNKELKCISVSELQTASAAFVPKVWQSIVILLTGPIGFFLSFMFEKRNKENADSCRECPECKEKFMIEGFLRKKIRLLEITCLLGFASVFYSLFFIAAIAYLIFKNHFALLFFASLWFAFDALFTKDQLWSAIKMDSELYELKAEMKKQHDSDVK